jgi:hypothetical protein
MDRHELLELVHSTSREQFTAKFPHLFLMIATRSLEDEDAGFNTLVAEPGTSRSSATRELQHVPIAKAPGNPYPDRISVGRARNCDVVLRDPSVSKLHAHFRVLPDGKLELVDLDSQNGTCVNHAPLAGNRPEPIKAGDLVLFGAVSARLVTSSQVYDLLR